ncbi:Putative Sirtuin family, DHS-like NAD/FAD-binding domain superfamily [Septoria linicola]|uniref:NAD-dependent protein deacetylase n=1 Tax=Septoria linicola TaxID=215465 RepID=A0A9Q9EP32_9PEZI|nr:Putative Sirtuin family, DHS-like NAD/FAD-binding domain superfamily [Septoria linicola]
MGNEESTPIDESTPPQTLAGRTLDALAEYIKSGKCKDVVIMTGAGISTSAGIPDFRSPETGLYANLARLDLPYAEAVFDISYFRQNPEPFYALAHELYPGKYRPTITHSFISLLHRKGMLLKCFTQNIDCLEQEAGVPDEKMIAAHGSFAKQSCIECKEPYPRDEIQVHVENKTIPHCHRCKGLVKPEIVFFGEQLPAAFFENRDAPATADLAIVMGTSLTVQPFASLPGFAREETPRLLINKERVGTLGTRADDVLLLEDCDTGVRRLAEACGWLEELEALWAETSVKAGTDIGKPASNQEDIEKTKDEKLSDEIDKLTKDVDETLNLSRWHADKVKNERLPGEKPASAKTHESEDSGLSHVFVGGQTASAPKVDGSGSVGKAGAEGKDDASKL